MFCRETVRDTRRSAERDFGFPRTVFVFQEDVRTGQELFSSLWPAAPAIADPTLHLYEAFGIRRASADQVFGADVWRAGWRALRSGNLPGLPSSDPWVMPGAFLVQDGVVHWSQRFRHAGEEVAFETVERLAAEIDVLAPPPELLACSVC